MTNSTQAYPGDGVQRDFQYEKGYIVTAHVTVSIDSVPQTDGVHYTWLNATTVRFTVAPPNGSTVSFTRASSQGERLVDHKSGSALPESDLDTDGDQSFYMAQEALDAAQEAKDAVGGAGNVPSPGAQDVGKVFKATGVGTASWQNEQLIGLLGAKDSVAAGDIDANAVGPNELANDAVDTAAVQDNAITLAKLAGGTAGHLIGFDGNGDPAELEAGGAILHLRHTEAQGVGGGNSTPGVWTKRKQNVVVENSIAGATHNTTTYVTRLPAGTYRVRGSQTFYRTNHSAGRIFDTTNSVVLADGQAVYANGAQSSPSEIYGHAVSANIYDVFTLADEADVEFQYHAFSNQSSFSLGYPANIASREEVYADLVIEKVA